MRLTFRKVIFLVCLIVAITCAFVLFFKQVVHPILEKKPVFQEDVVFQKTQEAKIKANIEKLLGKKTFIVVVRLNNKDVKECLIEDEPNVIFSNYTEDISMSMKEDERAYEYHRPKVSEIKKEIADISESLGFDFQSVATTVVDLPSFLSYLNSTYDTRVLVDAKVSSNVMSGAMVSSVQAKTSITISNQIEKTRDHIILNKKTTETLIPRKRIDRVVVTVVIDNDYFSYLDLEKKMLKNLFYLCQV